MKSNPRFVWNIGAIAEVYPDMPKQDGCEVVLWDRQEQKPVVTISDGYAQAFCLELSNSDHGQPFTTMESWFNSLSNQALLSEGMKSTKSPFTKGTK